MIVLDKPPHCLRFKTEAWDRFIRNSHSLRHRHESVQNDSRTDLEQSDAIISKPLYSSSKETFKKLLADTLQVCIKTEQWSSKWPVRPRSNPCVQSPSAILDLPNIRNNFCSNLMDWSSTDYLTVAFPRSVYLWYASKNTTVRFPVANANCIKWTCDGRNLFTATRNGSYKLTDMERPDNSYVNGQCSCHLNCHVTCCNFNPTDSYLILGCSRGAFSVYCTWKEMHLLYYQQVDIDPVTSVEFSCDGKHFSVSSLNGVVGVYESMNKQALLFINMTGPVRAVSWHPWERSSLLIGDCMGNMKLYNVLVTRELIASYSSIYNHSIVCLKFSPISGELVVSSRLYGSIDDDQYADTQINVLASFDRVVDRLEGHTGRVLCMNWSPDGTKLATSGNDETARIWEFLPQRKKNMLTQKVSESDFITSNLVEFGNRVGQALR